MAENTVRVGAITVPDADDLDDDAGMGLSGGIASAEPEVDLGGEAPPAPLPMKETTEELTPEEQGHLAGVIDLTAGAPVGEGLPDAEVPKREKKPKKGAKGALTPEQRMGAASMLAPILGAALRWLPRFFGSPMTPELFVAQRANALPGGSGGAPYDLHMEPLLTGDLANGIETWVTVVFRPILGADKKPAVDQRGELMRAPVMLLPGRASPPLPGDTVQHMPATLEFALAWNLADGPAAQMESAGEWLAANEGTVRAVAAGLGLAAYAFAAYQSRGVNLAPATAAPVSPPNETPAG